MSPRPRVDPSPDQKQAWDQAAIADTLGGIEYAKGCTCERSIRFVRDLNPKPCHHRIGTCAAYRVTHQGECPRVQSETLYAFHGHESYRKRRGVEPAYVEHL